MRKLSLLLGALLVALAVRGQLRICGSCGREDTTGGAVCACISSDAALRIIATGPEGPTCLHIPLADPARATSTAA